MPRGTFDSPSNERRAAELREHLASRASALCAVQELGTPRLLCRLDGVVRVGQRPALGILHLQAVLDVPVPAASVILRRHRHRSNLVDELRQVHAVLLVPVVGLGSRAKRNAVHRVHQRNHRLAYALLGARQEQACVDDFTQSLPHLGARHRVAHKALEPRHEAHLDRPSADALQLLEGGAEVAEERGRGHEVPCAIEESVCVLAPSVQSVSQLRVDVVLRLRAVQLRERRLHLRVLERRVHAVDNLGETDVVPRVLYLVLEHAERITPLVETQ